MNRTFPFYMQMNNMDCGPTCLRMISAYYGKNYTLNTLRDKCFLTREGVSLQGICDAAESLGFKSVGVSLFFHQMVKEAPLPIILHWKQHHFVVLYKIKKQRRSGRTPSGYMFYIADPSRGKYVVDEKAFRENWLARKNTVDLQGICLLMEPTPDFFISEDEDIKKGSISYFKKYFKLYRGQFSQLIIGLMAVSIIQLLFPFLTQSIVDVGILTEDLSFIHVVLFALLFLFISRTAIEFIRSWILLHVSTRINISLIADYLSKLMRLPLAYFDTSKAGDVIQRVIDHRRIENFLTTSSLNILFSLFNLVVFGIVLAIYSTKILIIFLLGTILYAGWITLFLNKRRQLDFKKFGKQSDNQSKIIELVNGMQEIKLSNAEYLKRWEWESLQASLFRINVNILSQNQYQQAGALFLNEFKNIIILFIAATAVINGAMTLGMMLAIVYILGQLNSPVEQMIVLFHGYQDAKISMERLGEIQVLDDEVKKEASYFHQVPAEKKIEVRNVSFQYEGPHSPKVLNDLSFTIPSDKITAIVGRSGSGKTTLLKLLLGFYPPLEGNILVDDVHLQAIHPKVWRNNIGVVMQDGYLFADTIAKNIALGLEEINENQLKYAAQVAKAYDFIRSLPLGFNTKIGANGHGLSGGEKQRILIARAIYKNPDFIFLDEATSSLDAENEKSIMGNLQDYFKGKTVLIVAHRLSTVKDADQIIVMERGRIIESGDHDQLTINKGVYFELIKNQLELGN